MYSYKDWDPLIHYLLPTFLSSEILKSRKELFHKTPFPNKNGDLNLLIVTTSNILSKITLDDKFWDIHF